MRSCVLFSLAVIACGADAPRPSAAPPVAAVSAGPTERSRLGACAAEPDGRWALPAELTEASGLASEGSAVLVHGDEVGRIYRVTPAGGAVLATALRGDPKDDFEGIAIAGPRIVLSTSEGRLYVSDWPAGAVAPFRRVETGLGRGCELEGLGWDGARGILLLPCKRFRGKGRRDGLEVRRWNLARSVALAPVTVSAGALASAGLDGFRPSALEVDPATGNWLLLSANPTALLEITASGAVVRAVRLGRGHRQPEGLALTPAGDLLVADEGAGEAGQLSRYRCALP